MLKRARLAAQVSLAALLLTLGVASAQATPIVVATVAPSGSLFHYSYAITFNQSPADEIVVLTVNLLPGDTLTNRTAPTGFQISYDTNLGFLDFLPDLGATFPLTGTVSGFSFDSPRGPVPTTFSAVSLSGNGDVQGAPITVNAVPEPVTSVLVAIGLGMLGGRRAIRKHLGARS